MDYISEFCPDMKRTRTRTCSNDSGCDVICEPSSDPLDDLVNTWGDMMEKVVRQEVAKAKDVLMDQLNPQKCHRDIEHVMDCTVAFVECVNYDVRNEIKAHVSKHTNIKHRIEKIFEEETHKCLQDEYIGTENDLLNESVAMDELSQDWDWISEELEDCNDQTDSRLHKNFYDDNQAEPYWNNFNFWKSPDLVIEDCTAKNNSHDLHITIEKKDIITWVHPNADDLLITLEKDEHNNENLLNQKQYVNSWLSNHHNLS